MVHVAIEKYYDFRNSEDKGNDCYFLIVCKTPKFGIDDCFYSFEISEEFKIDYADLAVRCGGFVDDRDVFFSKKYQAKLCEKELKKIINKKN